MIVMNNDVVLGNGKAVSDVAPVTVLTSMTGCPVMGPPAKAPEDYLEKLMADVDAHVEASVRRDLRKLLEDDEDISPKASMTVDKLEWYAITLTPANASGLRKSLRRNPGIIRDQTKTIWENGLVKPAHSEWASNMVLVKKKSRDNVLQ